jgi:N,N'-diacetyllegionaminate synthase
MKSVKIFDKFVGDGHPCYTIAEIGGAFTNFEEAKRLIDSAIEINVDAVKFQTLEADTITTKNNFFDFEITGNISQYELFKHFELSKELQKQVVNYANDCKIPIFSAPSHMQDLEIMKEMDLSIFKIGSDLACHIPLLKEVSKLNKPIILSTGMCSLEEVRDSVNAIISEGNDQLILMHCVSNYPSSVDELNLEAINTMKKEFNLPVGFSDHTPGIMSTFASAVMGANIIERHFRDPRNSPGPDDAHSLIKEEFEQLIQSIHGFEKSKGSGEKIPTLSEQRILNSNRVSIIAMRNISAGEIITKKMIDIRRPGTGLSPKYVENIIGKKTKIHINDEEPLTWNMLE